MYAVLLSKVLIDVSNEPRPDDLEFAAIVQPRQSPRNNSEIEYGAIHQAELFTDPRGPALQYHGLEIAALGAAIIGSRRRQYRTE